MGDGVGHYPALVASPHGAPDCGLVTLQGALGLKGSEGPPGPPGPAVSGAGPVQAFEQPIIQNRLCRQDGLVSRPVRVHG